MWNRRQGKRWRPQPAGGFTLLEIVVAVAIVAVVLVALIGLQLRSLDATIRAQDLTTAVLLAQGKLASLGTFPEPGEDKGTFEGPELDRFHWTTTVVEHKFEALAGNQAVEVRQLGVTVSWKDGQQERHYTLETYGIQ